MEVKVREPWYCFVVGRGESRGKCVGGYYESQAPVWMQVAFFLFYSQAL